MISSLKTLHGELSLPAFFPDATRAVVKGAVDSIDLEQADIPGVVVNTLHLGELLLKDDDHTTQDIHDFMNWHHPIITDSGGFQVMSLIHSNPKLGYLTDNEAVFINEHGQKVVFTPEKSIQLQMRLGADILICLDDCTHPDDTQDVQAHSVERTINWAKRCKVEFERLTADMEQKPLLFGVIQGGNSKELRKQCAEALIEMNFDGYCFGGWPVDSERVFLSDIVAFTAQCMPDDKPKYAMGIGKPENIIECFGMGYDLFDCVIPTREARHKRIYLWKEDPQSVVQADQLTYHYMTLQHAIYKSDPAPLDVFCDCYTCGHYSRKYLHHLFKLKDPLAFRLATIHNLRFYTRLIKQLPKLSKPE